MQGLAILAPALVAGCLSFALTPVARWVALRLGAVDHPDQRKVHAQPMPRLGGLAIVASAGIVLGVGALGFGRVQPWLHGELHLSVALGLLPILAVSIWDDIHPVRPLPRLLAQVLGAGFVVWWGVALQPTVHLLGYPIALGAFAVPLSVVWIIGVTNAFNLVDGLDGLSAGLGLISSVSLAAVFLLSGQTDTAAATIILAGALVGFLPYNIDPARIFLGDSGATAISFALACFALRGGSTLSAGFATLLPVFVLGLPISDTLVSIARRVLARFSKMQRSGVMEADHNHIHHRLLALGLDHRRAVFLLYGVGIIFAAAALVSLLMTAREAGFLLAGLLLAGFVGLRSLGYEELAVVRNGLILILRFYDAPVLKKSIFIVFVDVALIGLAIYGAVVLKYEDWSLAAHRTLALGMLAVTVPASVTVLWLGGLYRGSWRLAGLTDFVRAGKAVAGATVAGSVVNFVAAPVAAPASLLGIFGLLTFILIIGARVS